MKPRYTPEEARRVMGRWATFLVACFVLTVVLNLSFSRYLIAQREGDPDTHLNRAESRMAALDLKGALVSVENAMDRAPLYPRAHKVHGDILFKQEDWKNAEIAYRKCLNLGGAYEGVQNNILWSLIMQEAYDEAVGLGREFLAGREPSRLVPRYVAEACLRAGRWSDAVDYLRQALEPNPREPYLLDRLRQAYNKLGMKKEEDRVLALLNEVEMAQEKEQVLTQLPTDARE